MHHRATQLPRVCVIGAGSSGIAAAKALHQRGFAFDCYEKSDRVGGNWVFGNRNGMSSVYRSLHINTSRERMQYSDFPLPSDYPDFPGHEQVAAYFEAYVERFGFRERIRFETGVERAERLTGGGWVVRLESGETRGYDALLVANGHHWDPAWPAPGFPGSEGFAGRQLHSHDYTGEDPELLRDKAVVVLGMGNSAMDIAVEASYSARRVFLAARRGAHVVPKYLLGRPLDHWATSARIPLPVRRRLYAGLVRLAVGDPTRYGLPRPDHRLGGAHPTVSSDIYGRIGHGEVVPKPNLAALGERTVRFADGSEEEADVVVYCTGYKVSFPFFDPAFVSAPDNDLPLFRRMFHPEVPDLLFIGLCQPLGAVMPIAELQGQWACDYLAGRYHLPAPAAVRADVAAERSRMFKRYVASRRHTMQVDFDDYVAGVGAERRRGAERAREHGFALPVRAAAPV